MEQWWNDIDGKTKGLREKPIPFLLCPPQIPTCTDLVANSGLHFEKPATNDLSYGTAYNEITQELLVELLHFELQCSS
jgi:hypothetical protein